MKLNRTIRRILATMMILALAMTGAAAALAETATVYAAVEGAKVYDSKGEVIGTLPVNTAVTLTGMKGKVCRVERDGVTAYMLKSELSKSAAAQPEAQQESDAGKHVTAYAKRDGTKVYDADGATLATLTLNAEVTVTAVKGKACKVTVDGKTGYMKKSDLSASKVAQQGKSVAAYVAREGAKLYSESGETLTTLSVNAEVAVTAVKGKVCRVTAGGKTGYMKKSDLSKDLTDIVVPEKESVSYGDSTVKPAKGTAVEMDWWTSDIQQIFARGGVAQITDVETGISWREQRRGGTNHADCQPLTAADTAAMKKACGSWSWNRRAIFVTINGVNYAASMNCMPHGSGAITDNNFNGHHCIHFTNSRTHGSNKVCPQHQAAIKKAAAATLR